MPFPVSKKFEIAFFTMHATLRREPGHLLPNFETVMRKMMDWKKTLSAIPQLKQRLLQFKILVGFVESRVQASSFGRVQ